MAAVSMSFNLVGAFKGLSMSSGPSSSSSAFVRGDLGSLVAGPTKVSFSCPQRFPLTIESAHKKGAGSTKNGRDSRGQRLGVKIFGDQVAKPGSIIVRQRGTKVFPFPFFFFFAIYLNLNLLYLCTIQFSLEF